MPKSRSNDVKKKDVTQSVMGNENTRKMMGQVDGMSSEGAVTPEGSPNFTGQGRMPTATWSEIVQGPARPPDTRNPVTKFIDTEAEMIAGAANEFMYNVKELASDIFKKKPKKK